MSANEGPPRSDYQKAKELPKCGAECEHEHGDQAEDAEGLELLALRDEVMHLRRRLPAAQAIANGIQCHNGPGSLDKAAIKAMQWKAEAVGKELADARAELRLLEAKVADLSDDRLRSDAVAELARSRAATLGAEVADLKSERECILATRKFWIFSDREMIRRRDLAACRAHAEEREKFVHDLHDENTALRSGVVHQSAISEEREACALVAQHHTDCGLARDIAAAIRARGGA